MRAPDAGAPCWVDGRRLGLEQAAVRLDDPGLLAGLGLFETLAIRRGQILDLHPHLDRLARGAERLGIAMPDLGQLVAVMQDVALAQSTTSSWLKIVITAAGRWVVFGGTLDPAQEGQAATAVLLPWRRNPRDALAGLKSLNYAPNVLGLDYARRRGADEGLWLNTRGHLAEGCSSNLFVVRTGRIFTPSEREGILPGVVRALVLRAARELGLGLHEGRVRLHSLERASEAFLTSSLRGVRPLVGFGGRPVGPGAPGQLTRRIATEVARLRGEGLARPPES